jgi:hypothetical protein
LQWYYNSSVLTGETDTLHIAQNNGDYFVEVTDSFGCKNMSDTLNITVLGIEVISNQMANVYPNPSNGNLTIEIIDQKFKSISIVNVLGEEILNQPIYSSEEKIDLNAFAEGIYYIKLSSPKKEFVSKIILLR